MARELSSKVMAEFIKFDKKFIKVAGQIKKYEPNSVNGPFILLEPALVRLANEQVFTRYQGLAVGLATDLRIKLQFPQHLNEFVSIELIDYEPARRANHSPRKIFSVHLLDRVEILELAQNSNKVDDVYRKPVDTVSDDPTADSKDDSDDLPF